MSFYGVQVTLIFLLTFLNTEAKKPPGYVAPPKEYDPDPPKYEYGYRIQEEKATHGKDEQRDGIYAQGRYYVEKGTEASQSVKYFADDWGYHPVVEYSNNHSPYSKSSTNFVLGEEAIKLKYNQKSIPQDPSDPGKAENLAKIGPTSINKPEQLVIQNVILPQQPHDNQLLVIQPQQVITENQSEKPTVVQLQEDHPQIAQTLIGQPQIEILSTTPSPVTEHQILVSDQPTNADYLLSSNHNEPQLINSNDLQTIILQSTPQPEILLQKKSELIKQDLPIIRLENVQANKLNELNNLPVLINAKSELRGVLTEHTSETKTQPQPIFYYVQPQRGQFDPSNAPSSAKNQLISESLQPQLQIEATGAENQLLYPVQQYEPIIQHQQIVHSDQVVQDFSKSQQSIGQEKVVIQQQESRAQPQALIYQERKKNVIVEEFQNNPNWPFGESLIHNGILEVKLDGGPVLETAALTKIPNKIVEGSNRYREFGAKINPKTVTQSSVRNLIESTKNLISGVDVLNINAAISQDHSSIEEIESSTLKSLLNQYVTPTIVNNHVNVDINHFEDVSSTTVAPPVSSIKTSLLNEPIVVAEDSGNKPVIEKTEENKDYFSTTSRSSLISSSTATSLNDENPSEQILVTPRPVSSKFLIPITAGVQLQHIEEPIFEDTKTIKTNEGYQKKANFVVQVQKTIPYYLGMYEYPLGYAAQYRGHNITKQEKAIENIELGKTLLYFPEPDISKSDRLVQELRKAEYSQEIPEVISNSLTGEQLPFKHTNRGFAAIDQQAVQAHQQLFVLKVQTEQPAFAQVGGAESKVQEQFYDKNEHQQQEKHAPAEVTKIVHHAYPVPYSVVQKIPYPQPYPVEKIVERPVHVPVQVPVEVTKFIDRPYPVEVHVPYPQPYPVEKVVKEPYPVPVQVQVPVPHPVPVEKIVERKVHVPYYIEKPVERIVEKPVEKIVERKIPVPYYIEKPLERVVEKHVPHYINRPHPVGDSVQNPQVQQAYLLQIPGLFSQEKYRSLIHNTYQPQQLQIQYSLNGHQNKNLIQNQYSGGNLGYQDVNPYSYASQINQYLPPKQELHLNRGQIPSRLQQLNLLVLPRVHVPVNLPPITKDQHDLQQSQSYQSFRQSKAQLDNGYLPPVPQQNGCEHSDHLQASASKLNNNVKYPEEHIGLVPPKCQPTDDGKYRTARSHFDDKSIRLEYGFMPPLIPSLEIDEQGQPVGKNDNNN